METRWKYSESTCHTCQRIFPSVEQYLVFIKNCRNRIECRIVFPRKYLYSPTDWFPVPKEKFKIELKI